MRLSDPSPVDEHPASRDSGREESPRPSRTPADSSAGPHRATDVQPDSIADGNMRTADNEQDRAPDGAEVEQSRRGMFWRKLLHMSPGLLPFALNWLPHNRPLQTADILVVSTIVCVMTLVYIGLRSVVQRPNETDFWATTLSYPLMVLATLILFPAYSELTCVVVVILAFGDGSAYIFGKRFGRRKLPWNPQKSWAGTLGFVAVAGPAASLAYWMEANHPWVTWSPPLPEVIPVWVAITCGTVAAVCAAIAESLPTRITDNLRVGFAALVAVAITHYSLGWAGLRWMM